MKPGMNIHRGKYRPPSALTKLEIPGRYLARDCCGSCVCACLTEFGLSVCVSRNTRHKLCEAHLSTSRMTSRDLSFSIDRIWAVPHGTSRPIVHVDTQMWLHSKQWYYTCFNKTVGPSF